MNNRNKINFLYTVPILLVLYVIGALVKPLNLGNQLVYIGVTGIKMVLVIVLAILLAVTFYKLMLHTSIAGMVSDLKRFEHRTGYENLSRAFMLAGIIGMAAQIIGWPTASTFSNYVYELLTKGSIALGLAMVGAFMFGAFFLKLKSNSEFACYLNDPRNNQVVLILMFVVNVIVFIAMR
jgi:hypothetical protein